MHHFLYFFSLKNVILLFLSIISRMHAYELDGIMLSALWLFSLHAVTLTKHRSK